MLKHVNIILFGSVQGVFLRRTVEHEAKRQEIMGFIRNETDGTVYIEVEGIDQKIDTFVGWLKAGAGEGEGDYQIKEVDVSPGSFKGFNEFEIKE